MAGAFDRAALLAALESEAAILQRLLDGCSDEVLHERVRLDGWSAHAILAHIADSTYGLALMITGDIPVTLQTDETVGWVSPHEYNEQRRQKNATLSRAKLNERLAGGFAAARRALEQEQQAEAPGPTGGQFTRGDWHGRVVEHIQGHRAELEALIG
jgi:uncharacterized damage-inducible protein DinB